MQQHPKAYAVDKDRAAHLLDTLKTQLPPEAFSAALARGQALDLLIVTQELLAES